MTGEEFRIWIAKHPAWARARRIIEPKTLGQLLKTLPE